ncbi:MAG: LysR family transcriptional regulator [Pirellulaceae bacterium]|nr:LysR family transcriptional regulator [Pirellulaceae bacterium]
MNLPSPRSGLHKVDSLTAQQIDTFCQVYEQGGYAGAADALGLAGPTIWEQVKSLERIYQTKLFERVGGEHLEAAFAERVRVL